MQVGKPKMLPHDYRHRKQRQCAERDNYLNTFSLRVTACTPSTKLVMNVYPSSIRLLIDKQNGFQLFGNHQNSHDNTANRWKKFDQTKQRSNLALTKPHTGKIIELVVSRLYTLRNQIIHCAATWVTQVNDGEPGGQTCTRHY
jgi:hypothetical protein